MEITEQDRSIIELMKVHRSLKVISRTLHLTEGRVKHRLFRAARILRDGGDVPSAEALEKLFALSGL
jgi:DNA-directed RNA polymerase specialized sigma24 family protein